MMKNYDRMYFAKAITIVLAFIFGFTSALYAREQQETEEQVEVEIDEEFKWLQEEAFNTVVITATRTETPLAKVTKSISVVSQKDMEDAQEFFFPEMTDNIPGVFFKRNGGMGQLFRINMRGAEAQYVQFQYNGIPLRDATDMQNTFQAYIQDFYFGTNHRIEVLRGTNSVLYGSQAMSGVINIIPDKWKKGLMLELRNEAGEHSTYIENARIAYGQDNYYIDLNPVYINTNGEKNEGEFDYYYKKFGFSAGAGIKPGENISLELNALFSDNDAAMNENTPFLDADLNLVKNRASGDKYLENRFYQAGLVLNHKISSSWDYILKGSYTDTHRTYYMSDVPGDETVYKGGTTYFEMQHNIYPANWLTLTIGADYEKSDFDQQDPFDKYQGIYTPVHFEYNWDLWDAFSNIQFSFLDDSLLFSTGVRYNNHEIFDAKTVWDVSAAYIFDTYGTKIHAHAGTGYRTPSIYEIYGGYLLMGELVTVGNPELEPEESTGYEIGLDQYLAGNRINAGITYFRIDFDNLVVYDIFQRKYRNATESKTSGVEGYLYIKPCKYFKAGMSYTYADPEYADYITGEWVRKENYPRNKLNFTSFFYPTDKLTAFCRVTWMDEKIVPLYDMNFNKALWEEKSVTTVDMAVTYNITESFDIWVKAENLFDEDYSEGGFAMQGRWVYGGIRLKI
ncbi:MAG: TonB-dependent receptor [Desulfobacteraceae bacterium]|nr:TonB-dependent receptor [Desulfobacteraceae bacterium]